MGNFVFISDFDGTLTNKDFYQIVIDKYLKQEGQELLKNWKNGEMTNFDFLKTIFSSINQTQKQIDQDILSIPFDEFAPSFIQEIKRLGGDMIILSAGSDYYINKVLEHYKISDVEVIANKSTIKDGGISMMADEQSKYYSQSDGVNKEKVLNDLRSKYDILYFAGDSKPDFKASLVADVIFAKRHLQKMLREINKDFVAVDNFKQIYEYLKTERSDMYV